jgi:hypothetical protein
MKELSIRRQKEIEDISIEIGEITSTKGIKTVRNFHSTRSMTPHDIISQVTEPTEKKAKEV